MNNEEPNPGKIFDITFAFTTTRVLITAIDLELFTHIARGNHTVAQIAKAASASERGVEIILNGLTSLDYLTKSNGTYDLTPLSEKFLVKGKPFKKIEKEHGPEFFEKMVVQIFPMS